MFCDWSGLSWVGDVFPAAAVIGARFMHDHFVRYEEVEIYQHQIHPEAADPLEPPKPLYPAKPTSVFVEKSSQMFPALSPDNYDDA